MRYSAALSKECCGSQISAVARSVFPLTLVLSVENPKQRAGEQNTLPCVGPSPCRQVNEIYRDLANIVEQQQEAVEEIETNTEGAHARAQEGLVQVYAMYPRLSRSYVLQMGASRGICPLFRCSGSSLVDRVRWLLHDTHWLSREGLYCVAVGKGTPTSFACTDGHSSLGVPTLV